MFYRFILSVLILPAGWLFFGASPRVVSPLLYSTLRPMPDRAGLESTVRGPAGTSIRQVSDEELAATLQTLLAQEAAKGLFPEPPSPKTRFYLPSIPAFVHYAGSRAATHRPPEALYPEDCCRLDEDRLRRRGEGGFRWRDWHVHGTFPLVEGHMQLVATEHGVRPMDQAKLGDMVDAALLLPGYRVVDNYSRQLEDGSFIHMGRSVPDHDHLHLIPEVFPAEMDQVSWRHWRKIGEVGGVTFWRTVDLPNRVRLIEGASRDQVVRAAALYAARILDQAIRQMPGQVQGYNTAVVSPDGKNIRVYFVPRRVFGDSRVMPMNAEGRLLSLDQYRRLPSAQRRRFYYFGPATDQMLGAMYTPDWGTYLRLKNNRERAMRVISQLWDALSTSEPTLQRLDQGFLTRWRESQAGLEGGSETSEPSGGSPAPVSLTGTPVSPDEAGITEAEYVDQLQAYVHSLGDPNNLPPNGGPLLKGDVRHVAFFYPYALYTGGGGTFQRNILEALLKTHQGLLLELLYLNFGHEETQWELRDPVRDNRVILHGIPSKEPDGQDLPKRELASRLQAVLHRIHEAQRVDLIVNNNSTHLYEMSLGLLGFARDRGIPTHLYFHGGRMTEGVRFLMQQSDGAVTNSNAFQRIFSKFGVSADVIHPIPDVSYFLDPLTDEDHHAIQRLIEVRGLKGKKVILQPGRLYPFKGQEDTVLAAEILKSHHPDIAQDVVFVIIGPARNVGEKERLSALSAEKKVDVIWVGSQSRQQMRWWYHLAYAVLYPTRGEEPFGLVPVEAQASGAPVIVTDVGGLPETVIEGETGLVVGRQDPEHLAQALLYLVTDERRRDDMSAAARRYVEQRYSPERTLGDFTESYLAAARVMRGRPVPVGSLEPPSDPEKVLYDIYDQRHRSDWYRRASESAAMIAQWKRAWLAKLNSAQPHWRSHPTLPYDYHKDAPGIAYDPSRVPVKPLGPYVQLVMGSNPDRGAFSITRASPQLGTGESNLLHQLELGFLMVDPSNDNILIVANGYPKVMYDSLLVTKEWQPQRLTREAIRAEIEWARRGAVLEYHHTEVFVDHLHIHLFAPDTIPVTRFSDSFVSQEESGGVAIGEMGYPVPHIALASSDPESLMDATSLMAEYLEGNDILFSQTVLPDRGKDHVIVLFHLWKGAPKGFSFSPVGFVKLANGEVDEEAVQMELGEIFVSGEELSQAGDAFWRQWKAEASGTAAGLEGVEGRIKEAVEIFRDTTRNKFDADRFALAIGWVRELLTQPGPLPDVLVRQVKILIAALAQISSGRDYIDWHPRDIDYHVMSDYSASVRKEAQQLLEVFHVVLREEGLLPFVWLPPIGGKIPVVVDEQGTEINDEWELLYPTWTAEEQVEEILRRRREGKLGSGYVHQMTVQGRLPDEFKYVALALILAGPYRNNWEEPFFEAPWGKVAPLVHDGGNVEMGLNPLWKGVWGRTDFLQRVVRVYVPNLEEVERLSEAEQIQRQREEQRPSEESLFERMESEEYERARLMLEAKAYQRLALALHVKLRTAPQEIPEEVREKLSQRWDDFRIKMDALLGEFGLAGAARVEWFTKQARQLAGWDDPRQEAEWEPIRRELIKLEEVRAEYPQLIHQANQLRLFRL